MRNGLISGRRVIPDRLAEAARSDAFLLAVLLLLAALLSMSLGQDDNWDLQNYHVYGPFALLQGRFHTDLFVAGIQTFYNPLLDVPYYLLAMDWLPHMPLLVTALAGLPYGALVYLTFCIARLALRPAWHGGSAAVVAVLIGATGSVTWSEIGTTTGDIPIAILLLGGCLILIRISMPDDAPRRRTILPCLVAGLLMGAACGLKPVAAVFALPAAIALAVALLPRPGQMARAVAAFGMGGVVGTAALYGWWGTRLYFAFGNPMGTYMNDLFRSPWFPLAAGTDQRFKPTSLIEALVYPFVWMRGGKDLVAEITYRDSRFAFAYLAVLALAAIAVAALVPGWRGRLTPALAIIAAPATRFLVTFAVLSFAMWEIAFSIIRYAVALEALTGILVMIALGAVFAALGEDTMPARRRLPVAATLAVLLIVSAQYGSWGRLRGRGALVFDIPVQTLPPESLVLIAGKPRAFLAPFLHGPDVAFLGVEELPGGTKLWDEAVRRVAGHTGPIFVLASESDPPWNQASPLAGLGVRPDMGACAGLANRFRSGMRLCQAARIGAPTP